MLGQVAPRNLYNLIEIRPDLRVMAALLKLKERNAHTLFGAIAEELKKDGIELIEPTPWLKPLMPGAGFRIGRELNGEERADVEFGYRIVKEIASWLLSSRALCWLWKGLKAQTNAWREEANWRASTAVPWPSKWQRSDTICVSTCRASARKRWRHAQRQGSTCLHSKQGRLCYWNKKLALNWQSVTK
jgi:hypothetical protein